MVGLLGMIFNNHVYTRNILLILGGIMFTYIRNSSLEKIRFKLIILYLLNALDLFFTLILIDTGKFLEVNPIINGVLDQPVNLLLIKILVPFLLILFLSIRLRKAERHQLIISNKIISGALIVYGFINLMHIFWIVVYL